MKQFPSAKVESATVNFRINLDDPRQIRSIKAAISPELTKVGPHQRCQMKMRDHSDTEKKEKSLRLEFSASDLVALRASLNINLRLLSSVIKTLNSLSALPKKEKG